MNLKNVNKKTLLSRAAACSAAFAVAMSGSGAMALDQSMDLETGDVTYTSTVTELEPISRNVIRKANADMPKGETATVQEGSDGLQEVEYKIFYANGIELERAEVSSEVVTDPVDKIVEYGTSNGGNPGFEYKYVLECEATAYDPSPEENGGYGGQSATGIPLQKGVIAVDPKVIPLGSRVYIEALDGSWSYGYAVAGDTGGAIKGNRVDLLYPTKSECYQFGRRKCRVYVL